MLEGILTAVVGLLAGVGLIVVVLAAVSIFGPTPGEVIECTCECRCDMGCCEG